jgi:hypothetical protein
VGDDRWVPPVGEEERGGCTDSGLRESGPWAGFLSGPEIVPGVQTFFFPSFLFSIFPFSFYSENLLYQKFGEKGAFEQYSLKDKVQNFGKDFEMQYAMNA